MTGVHGFGVKSHVGLGFRVQGSGFRRRTFGSKPRHRPKNLGPKPRKHFCQLAGKMLACSSGPHCRERTQTCWGRGPKLFYPEPDMVSNCCWTVEAQNPAPASKVGAKQRPFPDFLGVLGLRV